MAEKVRIIKKYQNRKLYDTQDSCYVTLDGIAKMIKNGEEISVIDNTTKNDVTALILTQVLYEQEKNNKSVVPLSVLKNIIQSGSNSMYEFMNKYVLNSIDTAARAKEEAQRHVEKLVQSGELTSNEGNAILKDLFSQLDSKDEIVGQKVDEKFKSVVEKLGNVDQYRAKISDLNQKIAELESKLTTLETAAGAPQVTPRTDIHAV